MAKPYREPTSLFDSPSIIIPDQATKRLAEPIYEDTSKIKTSTPRKEAIQKITEKYDTLAKLGNSVSEISFEDVDVTSPSTSPDLDVDDDVNNDVTMGLTDHDIMQVESFFRGNKTRVYVCAALANLYYITTESLNKGNGDWELVNTGIPTLILDGGDTKNRTQRKIQIVLAEKGTGFTLWKDTIDNLSNYKASQNNFHTMYLSTDHRRLVGFSFDDLGAAKDFYEKVENLTADPANISLSVPNLRKQKKNQRKVKKEKFKPPKKSDISQPCLFLHVTKVDLQDRSNYYSLSTLTPERLSVTKAVEV